MKNVLMLLSLTVLCCSCSNSTGNVEKAQNLQRGADPARLVKDNTAFAAKIYKELSSKKGNLLISPYSISSALAMTAAGAQGETEKQMLSTLCFSLPQEKLHPSFAELQGRLNEIQKDGKLSLQIANSLWPQKKYRFRPEYLSLLEKNYGAGITSLDYSKSREASEIINKWVESKTQEKIKNIISEANLSSLTRLVLVNAIYFKGNWQKQFAKEQTSEADFNVSPNETVKAQMMFMEDKFPYSQNEDCDIVELPYTGPLSMLVILPKTIGELKNIENSLSLEKIEAWRKGLADTKIKLCLPRFKFTFFSPLNEQLKALGMPDAFSDNSDFSGMDGSKDLFISFVLHKAFIEVNEEGTEAAAATAVVMKYRNGNSLPLFSANRPFLFLIQEKQNGSILFIGRVSDPTKSGE